MVPDVALTITVVVPAGVPVVLLFLEPPQPAAATSKPAATAIRIHVAVLPRPPRRADVCFSNVKSRKSTPANAKPSGHNRDDGPATIAIGAAPYIPVVTVEIVNCVVAALPAGVTMVGENEHVAPPGKPEHENDTALLNPFVGVIVRLVETDCPFMTVRACEAAAIEKFAPVGCVVPTAIDPNKPSPSFMRPAEK